MNLKSPPLTPDPKPMHRSQWCPALWVTFSSTARLRILNESEEDRVGRHRKKTQKEPSAIRPGEEPGRIWWTQSCEYFLLYRKKLDVLCYTCLNHIFIRFQYSSQLLKEQTLRLHTDRATKSLLRAFSCVKHIVLGHTLDFFLLYIKKWYLLLHNKVINVVSTFASISYHWSLSAVIRRTHSNFPMPLSGLKKRSNSAIRRQNAESLCFFFSPTVKFWGKTKFVSKKIFSS